MVFSLHSVLNSFRRHPQPRQSRRPGVEYLEGRCLLSGNVLQTNLVSDLPGVAQVQDPHLVNPWGIAESATSPFWIADNNAGVSMLYNSAGTPIPLVVSMPSPGDPLGSSGTPDGTVFNIDLAGGGFKVSGVNKAGVATSAPAVFLFATEDGTIIGWNPGVNPVGFDPAKAGTYGIIAVDNSTNPTAADGAVYKGLAIATDANGRTLLYSANFRSGTIDVFDTSFKPVALGKDAFFDQTLPRDFAPFNVQVLNGKIYVTYAKQDRFKHDPFSGPHRGFVDVFNLDGSPGLPGGNVRLISRGTLDSPWGLAFAPSSFGNLAGALLVGNFGNGEINAFDPTTGTFLTALKNPEGNSIHIDGLWALRVGNGANGGDANLVYFTAGLDAETHGLFGSLTPVAPVRPAGRADTQMVQAALDVFQTNLNVVRQDIAKGATAATLQQDIRTLDATSVRLIQAEIQLAQDSGANLSPHAQISLGPTSLVQKHGLKDLEAFFVALGMMPGDLK